MESKVIDHVTSHNSDYSFVMAPDLLKVLRFSAKKFTLDAFNYCLAHCDLFEMEVGEFYEYVEEITCRGGCYSTCSATCRN
jgi:hypothetical protein